jgi:hypothetical protein
MTKRSSFFLLGILLVSLCGCADQVTTTTTTITTTTVTGTTAGTTTTTSGSATTTTIGSSLVAPSDLTYLGAFRLPDSTVLPGAGFEWGGTGLAYYSSGDPGGPSDGFTGSLYGLGHE